jgi:hypothetical protein
MNAAQLAARYPTLYHMAEDKSWPGIREHGLLSTTALLDLYGYEGAARREVESEWRGRKHTLTKAGLPDVVVRDQLPMRPTNLAPILDDGLSPEDWYEFINKRIFFWPTVEDLHTFLAAKEYKNAAHVVISVPTARLMERHVEQVTLSAINSGSTYYNPERSNGPPRRGRATFQPINAFTGARVKEVVVQDGIADLVGLGATVEQWIAHRKNYDTPSFELLGRIWPTP